VDRFNAAGGAGGKTIELVVRDSKAQPDEAARVTRDLINSDGCEVIIDAEASTGSFAVQEVIREIGVVCIHTNSETSSLSADPNIRTETAFRCARQGIHDAVAGGLYAARAAKEQGIRRWMTCSPDYAYGRDNTSQFLEYLNIFADEVEVEVVDEAWPKLFEPDYTAFVTRMLQQRPDAIYSALWGGDLVSFIEQSNLYGLFGTGINFFSGSLADPPVLRAIKQLPSGLHSVYRYDPDYPATEANAAFASAYQERPGGALPTNWSWQTFTALQFLAEGLRRTDGDTDGRTLAGEIRGMTIDSPFSERGQITMRDTDQTIIHYPVAWGQTQSDPRSMVNWVPGDWEQILEQEAEWKARQGYA
jgi:branched-chain amino acid transport system substrate-binding protein